MAIAAPPSIVRASTIGLPDHIDAAALLAPSLLCWLQATSSGDRAAGRWAFASGVLAGLAVFFLFDALFVGLAIAVGAWWWVPSRRRLARWASLGAVVGCAPFVFGVGYWRTPGGQAVFGRLGRGLLLSSEADGSPGLWERVVLLVQDHGPAALGFADPMPVGPHLLRSEAAAGIYLGGFAVVAAAALLVRTDPERTVVARVAILGGGLHLVACIGSGLPLVNWFYLLPIWPWLVLAAAVGIVSLFERHVGLCLAGAGLLVIPLLLARPGPTVEVLQGPTPVSSAQQQYVDEELAHHLLAHPLGWGRLLNRSPAQLLASLRRRPDHRTDLTRLRGRSVFARGFRAERDEPTGQSPLDLAAAALADRPASRHPRHMLGAGEPAMVEALGEPGADVASVLTSAWAEGSLAPDAFRLGLGLGVVSMVFPGAVDEAADWALPPDQARWVCTALGLSGAENSVGSPLFDWGASLPWCDDRSVAHGFAVGLAFRLDPRADLVEPPHLSVWANRPMSDEADAVYRCALREVRGHVRRLVEPGWEVAPEGDLGAACLE